MGALVRKATQLAALTEALAAGLPAELARDCRVINLHERTVLLQAGGNAAAAKLRMLVPRLKDRLQPLAGPIEEIVVRVAPPVSRPAAARRGARLPPAAAAQSLAALAGRLEDSDLRRAVLSLAGKARN